MLRHSREAPSIAGVSPIHRKIAATVRYQDKQTDTPILFGVTPYYEFVHTQYVASGRFVNDIDMQDRSNVVIIGVDVKRRCSPMRIRSTRKSESTAIRIA